jgi:hydrogenase maturation protease
MTQATKLVLVLACGNTLRGDDGVGWHIGSALQDEFQNKPAESLVEVILTQQLLPEHAEPLSRSNTAVFLDCSAIAQPGAVSTQSLSPAQSMPRIFTHHLDPASLLKLTQDLYGRIPARTVSITIGGESFELRERLSEPVTAAIPMAVHEVHRVIFTSEPERRAATFVQNRRIISEGQSRERNSVYNSICSGPTPKRI